MGIGFPREGLETGATGIRAPERSVKKGKTGRLRSAAIDRYKYRVKLFSGSFHSVCFPDGLEVVDTLHPMDHG